MSEEILLELYRDFTDKERVNWITKDYYSLIRKFDAVVRQNNNLMRKNKSLEERIKKDDLQFASTLNGSTTVSVKAYLKLKGRYNELDKRFWEVVKERDELKNFENEKL